MRIIAILATCNEERFIDACLRHHTAQGVEVYVCDNESGDATREIAARFAGQGLAGLETLPRGNTFRWRDVLARKEQLARSLEADWFIHVDADEFFYPPPGFATLAEAIAEMDRQGFNAANAMEFVYVPTREESDHDHARFQESMHRYYPFEPRRPHRLCIWKKQSGPVDLVSSGGHQVQFPGLRMFETDFRMKHYLFLSPRHAVEKYQGRTYDPDEVRDGWHGWRARLTPDMIRLPAASELRLWTGDDSLDATNPRRTHCVEEPVDQRRGVSS
jgi:hypothetical protein